MELQDIIDIGNEMNKKALPVTGRVVYLKGGHNMKATIHTELRCGLCGQMMQYHQDIKVRCVQLKCKERNKEYHAPTIELYPTNTNATEVRVRHEEGVFEALPAYVISQMKEEYRREFERIEQERLAATKANGDQSPDTLSALEGSTVEVRADGGLDLTPGKVMPVDMESLEAEHFYKDEREMVAKSEGKKRGRPKTVKD